MDRSLYFFNSERKDNQDRYEDKIIANVFFEPSTRTKLSFEMAAKNLGAKVISFEKANSSINKGESLLDTLMTIEALGVDAIVLRHSDDNIFNDLKGKFSIPLINAGAGKFEHPSQGLLDLFTIRQEYKRLKGLKLAICGDIKHSRVAGSLMAVAKKLEFEVYLCGPQELLPEKLLENCFFSDIDEIIPLVDVFMCLRCQTERHDGVLFSPEEFHRKYGINRARASQLKPKSIIMHPAPVNWGIEIDEALRDLPKTRIFHQIKYGVYARMAILDLLLGSSK